MRAALSDVLTMRRRGWRLMAPMWALVVGLGLTGCSIGGDAADASPGSGAGSAQSAVRQSFVPPDDRKPAPALIGQTLTGDNLDLASLRGKAVVVNFWASWCGPCRDETPALMAVAGKHSSVAFVGVNREEEASAARAFVRDHGVAYPNIVDRTGTLAARWPGVPGLPTTFVLDPMGRIAARLLSGITTDSLSAILDRVAAESPARRPAHKKVTEGI